MFRKRFYVQIDLHLHAITCPGVWLCKHGYLEVTIKTLGYIFRTGAMEPRFPLLAHDEFTIEGYFKSVGSMDELERVLAAERVEITLWQSGRRLAYFVGKLSDVMQANGFPKIICEHNINVQLLMKATPAFPGIIAPKVELSASVGIRDRLGSTNHRASSKRQQRSSSATSQRSLSYRGDFVVPNFQLKIPAKQNRHFIKSNSPLSQPNCSDLMEQPRRQQTVCHTSCKRSCFYGTKSPVHCSTPQYAPSSSLNGNCLFEANAIKHKNTQRRSSTCSSQSFELSHSSTCLTDDSSDLCTHSWHSSGPTNVILNSKDHQELCEICQSYRKAFMSFKI